MKNRFLVVSAAVSAVAVPLAAHAAVLDLTAASAGITAELSPALAAAMPIMGTLLAIKVGLMLYKRITKG